MKMRLHEAKELLRRAGYLVRSLNEDTETDDYAKWHNLIGKNYKKYFKYLKSLGVEDWYIENMLNPEYFQTFYGNEGVRTIEELEKVMKDKAEIFLQSEREDEELERKERAKKSLPFIDQAYDAFIDSAELEEDDDSFNIYKTKDGFNFAYKKSVWSDLGEWPIVQISITPDSIKWKQMDEDGKLISNEKKLSGSTEKKLTQIKRWINNEWWGYPD